MVRLLKRINWYIVTITTVLTVLLTWLIVSMNDWEGKCNEIGGIVESRYMYTQTITVNGVTTSTDIYSYHCMIDGNEVNV